MGERIYLNEGFTFSEKWDDESGYKPVRIPHTCKETPFHYFDEHIYQMVCGYKRNLMKDKSLSGKTVILTFDGIGHDSEVFLNGEQIAAHHCGYTAFSTDITDKLSDGANELFIKVNTREDINVPPFGNVIDYMTYGGIYRDVYLEIYDKRYITDQYIYSGHTSNGWYLAGNIELTNGDGTIKIYKDEELVTEAKAEDKLLTFKKYLKDVIPWSPENPKLYDIRTEYYDENGRLTDTRTMRLGFRVAHFKKNGFYLNGRRYKIRGLNRHQSYPYVGYAMPKSMQYLDADTLKKELGLNAVRTSHYPQSHYFLDRCDEIGLLVFTEIPGWQHIGDEEWKSQAISNVEDMVKQYRNHTSIILWGVRINESRDDDDFYRRTNEVAHRLDPIRQTGGVRCIKNSSLLEDVYTYNDFVHNGQNAGCTPKKKVTSDMEKSYLISEYNGHMFPTKNYDDEDHRADHAIRHANVLKAVKANSDIAGSFGWCMADYNTHKDFGSGDRICYHGVLDMFRNKKMAAFVYASLQKEVPVLEISTSMDIGEHPECIRGDAYIFTNADSVKMYKNDIFIKEFKNDKLPEPILIDDYIGNRLVDEEHMDKKTADQIGYALNLAARKGLSHLPKYVYPLAAKLVVLDKFTPQDALDLYNKYIGDWGGKSTVYRFEAIKDGEVVKTVIKEPMTSVHLEIKADHTELREDNSYDVALVTIRALDQNGNLLNYYNDPVVLSTSGDIEIMGPKVISLSGGMGGTFIKTCGPKGNKTGEGTLFVNDEKIDWRITYGG